jgi:hypothetical protein
MSKLVTPRWSKGLLEVEFHHLRRPRFLQIRRCWSYRHHTQVNTGSRLSGVPRQATFSYCHLLENGMYELAEDSSMPLKCNCLQFCHNRFLVIEIKTRLVVLPARNALSLHSRRRLPKGDLKTGECRARTQERRCDLTGCVGGLTSRRKHLCSGRLALRPWRWLHQKTVLDSERIRRGVPMRIIRITTSTAYSALA